MAVWPAMAAWQWRPLAAASDGTGFSKSRLSRVADVATNANPGLTHFNQQLDGLNDFIKSNDVPKEMAQRLRECTPRMCPAACNGGARHARAMICRATTVARMLMRAMAALRRMSRCAALCGAIPSSLPPPC